MRIPCDYCDRLATGALTACGFADGTGRRFSCDAHREDARSLRPYRGSRFPGVDFDNELMPALREQYPEAVIDRLLPGATAEWVHRVRSDDICPKREVVTLVKASAKTAVIRLASGKTKRVPIVKLAGIVAPGNCPGDQRLWTIRQ